MHQEDIHRNRIRDKYNRLKTKYKQYYLNKQICNHAAKMYQKHFSCTQAMCSDQSQAIAAMQFSK